MSTKVLPCVSKETAKTLGQVIADEGPTILKTWLDQLDEENPQIANEVRTWAMENNGSLESMLIGPMMVYQLLRAQVVANSVQL